MMRLHIYKDKDSYTNNLFKLILDIWFSDFNISSALPYRSLVHAYLPGSFISMTAIYQLFLAIHTTEIRSSDT